MIASQQPPEVTVMDGCASENIPLAGCSVLSSAEPTLYSAPE